MAIISFWGSSEKETGQTISTIAVSTMMAIDHNANILTITTGFKDRTIEESFWEPGKNSGLQKLLGVNANKNTVEGGVEGLVRVIQSNIARKGVVGNYVKVVFKDRLDVLPSPQTEDPKEYIEISKNYPKLLDFANQDYNMVFIDVDKRMPGEVQKEILLKSDIIVININQGLRSLNELLALRDANEIFRANNILVLIGKYDKYSKYNTKNVTRYLREKKPVLAIAYNTLFSEATTEGKAADYFLRYRNISDKTDRNAIFMEEAKKTCDEIAYKLQELQMRR